MVPGLANSDSSAKRLEKLEALLQLGSGERRLEMEQIRSLDPRTGATLDTLLAHEAAARTEEFLSEAVSPPVHDLAPGTWVGPYLIERPLGWGGMGMVHLAHRCEPYRQAVAIKRLREGMPAHLTLRFDAERQILATLVHPGIVRLLDGGTCPDGSPYLVMEYVAGSRLDEYCRERNASLEERVRLVYSVAEAMSYAHGQGIVHRDLKPSNILVDEQGRPHVTDFGLAKFNASVNAYGRTETNVLLGTPAYMAPERLNLGPGRDEPGTDVYSLGVILFALLSGRLPFEPCGTLDVPVRAVREDAPLLSRIDPAIPRDLETIMARALARDPRGRFADAGEMGEQLRRYLAGKPLSIHPPTAVDRLVRWAARRRRMLLAWGTSFALALVVMMGTLVHWNRELRRDQAALKATMRSMWAASTRLFEAIPRENQAARRFYGELTRSFESVSATGLVGADVSFDRQGAVMHRQLADALQSTGEFGAALLHYDRAITLLRPLPPRASDPRDRTWTEFDLFRALSGRAVALRKLGRLDESLANSIEAHHWIRGLTDRNPDDPAWGEARARHLLSQADLLRCLSRPSEAKRTVLEALEFARRSVRLAGDSADTTKLYTLMFALQEASEETCVKGEKEAYLRAAIQVAGLVLRESDDRAAREAARGAAVMLGSFLQEQGRHAEASDSYQRALEVAGEPSDPDAEDVELAEFRDRVMGALDECRRAIGLETADPGR